MKRLSRAARALWAKKARNAGLTWLPLATHLTDCMAVAELLWDEWLSAGGRSAVEKGVQNGSARKLLLFLAAAHDLGKATPLFQAKPSSFPPGDLDERIDEGLRNAGLPMLPYNEFSHPEKSPHALATQLILERAGFPPGIAAILGAHHGRPADSTMLDYQGIGSFPRNYHLGEQGRTAWCAVQSEVIGFALHMAGYENASDLPIPDLNAQVLLSALVIMADWIASNDRLFPYCELEEDGENLDSPSRASLAWDRLQLPEKWLPDFEWMHGEALYELRFGFPPRAVQRAASETAAGIASPGIFILEAPMGVGKTEAALAIAEAFACKTNRAGVFFALPTQATSDGVFPRILHWVNQLGGGHSMRLAHGKAQFNEAYRALFEGSHDVDVDADDGALVHSWFEGPKKALLADFVVGTIDQLLLAALKQKHLMLRHLGLSDKVVIIDECHAYDAYMNQYLDQALRWLGEYGVPVIVLSATLPAQRRQSLVSAYQNKRVKAALQRNLPRMDKVERAPVPVWAASRDYPLMTYTDGADVRQCTAESGLMPRAVKIERIDERDIAQCLSELLADGGCAGIIVNTVARAQQIASALRGRFGRDGVRLLHARFLTPDRMKNEAGLLEELGPPGKANRPGFLLVVGTQVIEQSLDVDFDLLITELCPMDLLLQRIGRLQRHDRSRPERLREARCFLLEPDKNAAHVYGKYLLMRTRALLPKQVNIPEDIPNLVQDTYDDNVQICALEGYDCAKKEWDARIEEKEQRAKTFRIGPPSRDGGTIVDWLNALNAFTEQQGEAAVRDADESFEVILIYERAGELRFLPWQHGGRAIPLDEMPDAETARALACQTIRMPRALCSPWRIERTLDALEEQNRSRFTRWRESPWLKGALFLALDDAFSACLCGYLLHYSREDGLLCIKEGDVDGGQGI